MFKIKQIIKKEKPYSVSLAFNEGTLKAEGETLLEALTLFAVSKLPKITTRGLLIAKKGKLERQQTLTVYQIKRLLINKVFRQIMADKMEILLR